MKIGLCACYDTYNYGSQLQSYASLVVLQELGCDVSLIKYKKKISFSLIVNSIPRVLNPSFVRRRIRIYNNRRMEKCNKVYSETISNRKCQHQRFIADHFEKYVNISYGYNALKCDATKYQAIVAGSDQLWLPSGMASNFYNLMFVPDKVRKISYATSFGVNSIPWYQHNKTRHYLERINWISVREESGRRIVESLTNKEAQVVIDPTMMLSADKWNANVGDRIITDNYIFCYFLGSSTKHREIVKTFADKEHLKVVNLAHIDEYVESDNYFENVNNVGPFEFVNLIKYADYIFTDSFHGSVFSILFQKKFIIFNRFRNEDSNSRNGRIDSLTRMFGLEDRRYNGDVEAIFKCIDYESVLCRLELERSKAREFLTNALSC